MTKFIRLLSLFCVFVFASNAAYSAGYTCDSIKQYTSCNAGYYMVNKDETRNNYTAVGNKCKVCPAGKYCTGSTNDATDCPADTYRSSTGGTAKTSCTSCGTGKTTNGKTGQTSSSACVASNISVKCDAGKYIASGKTTCDTACTSGYYCTGGTFTISSSGATADTGRTQCPGTTATVSLIGTWNGDTASTAGTKIEHCLAYGMAFTNVNGGSGTRRCFYTSGSGSTATYSTGCHYYHYTTCNAGYQMTYSGSYDSTPKDGNACTSCSVGTYKSSAGTAACTACPTSYTTASTGTTSINSCYLSVSCGYVRSGTSGTTTTQCAAGTYKAAHNAYYGSSYSCNTASKGYYAARGACSQTACSTLASGLFPNTSGTGSTSSSYCLSNTLSAGQYIQVTNSTTATKYTTCTSGYICPGGVYSYATGAVGRGSCAKGAYPSNNKCVLCSAGYTTTGPGAASCVTCQSQYPDYQPSGVAGGYAASTWASTTTTGYTTTTNSYGGTRLGSVSVSGKCKLTTCAAGYHLTPNSDDVVSCMDDDVSNYSSCYNSDYNESGAYWINSCDKCIADTYKSGTNGTQYCTVVPNGKTSAAGASTYSNCSNSSNVSTWTAMSPVAGSQWKSTSGTSSVSNVCKISTCATGYHLSNNTCVANTCTVSINTNSPTGGTPSAT
ncbi:MAG: hypothetical protein K2M34_02910, partial [Alphaproteobacteria bacterium]|nr:hypothetical protein [Alphaproteobacteria bacterium]